MDIQKGLTAAAARESAARFPTAYVGLSTDADAFHRAVTAVEHHRKLVRGSVGVALVARLLFEFNFVKLLGEHDNLVVQIPYIGVALLSYLLVILWMAKGAGDRLGFGMALGLGVVEATYLIVVALTQGPFDLRTAWAPLVAALAHLPMAIFALLVTRAYPPQDTKAPWILGFVVAVAFLAVPWAAPSLIDTMGW